MARVSQIEDKTVVAKMLADMKAAGGYRRLKEDGNPLSYFTVKKLRDKGFVKLEKTDKLPTKKKGRDPFMYVVTKAGERVIESAGVVKTATARKLTAEQKEAKNARRREKRAQERASQAA
ncbi:hypothetical protein EVB91_273 [Rhizobium phage RHph_I1_18]|nr:hypothetical protein EVB91_273 [Rhizobium phage RHph_I1_18]